MRILILTPEFEGAGGGIITYYRALLRALIREGAYVHVIEGSGFNAEQDRQRREIDGVIVERLEAARLSVCLKRFSAYAAMPTLRLHLAAAWAMWEQVGFGEGFDIVEACDWGLSFVPPAIESSLPLVVQAHGSIGQIADHDPIAGQASDETLARLIERSVLSAAGTLQTSTAANAAFWRDETGRDVSILLPAWEGRSSYEPSELCERGLVVGRLQRWKGPATVCEALRQLGQEAPKIDWYGRDTLWGSRKTATSQHLREVYSDVWNQNFNYRNQVEPSEIVRLQSQALFNLVPSTWDVFNFTVVEAMASARPTIVSTGAGASELIADGVNGYLFPSNDAKALAGTIARVRNEDPAKLAAVGREARKTVREKLNPESVARARLAAYGEVIAKFKSYRHEPITGWLASACSPSGGSKDDLSFLESVPLSGVLQNGAMRVLRKLGLQ